MPDDTDNPTPPPDGGTKISQSPLRRISQIQVSPASDPEAARLLLKPEAPNRRYWVRLNVSPLGWVALVEQSEGGFTSTLGDVLDLSGGGCVMLLSSVPDDILDGQREVTVSIRPGPDQIVTCSGDVLGWQQTDNGVELRIAFHSTDAAVQKQLNDVAYTARLRLLQIEHGNQ